jgi:hypothetical protein
MRLLLISILLLISSSLFAQSIEVFYVTDTVYVEGDKKCRHEWFYSEKVDYWTFDLISEFCIKHDLIEERIIKLSKLGNGFCRLWYAGYRECSKCGRYEFMHEEKYLK